MFELPPSPPLVFLPLVGSTYSTKLCPPLCPSCSAFRLKSVLSRKVLAAALELNTDRSGPCFPSAVYSSVRSIKSRAKESMVNSDKLSVCHSIQIVFETTFCILLSTGIIHVLNHAGSDKLQLTCLLCSGLRARVMH